MSVVFEGIVYSVFICICWNSITFVAQFQARMRLSTWLHSGCNISSGRRLHPQLRGCIK